jgi:hypothetical protein
MNPSFLFRATRWYNDWRVKVFVGPDRDHRQMAGTLLLHPAEWEYLKGCFVGPASFTSIDVEEPSEP